ncbi:MULTISPECIES: hypothetical protein [unclassified Aquimarina]|uniref:hypothetical protein n=1 Tax=unclassified Aquimarina TaxID=2627091 RepID=UPI0018CA445E|nr:MULTISPECIES: hypothetical protein [unclassified Aquimarina]MBG6130721.1 hypothetical protein [Aquimarina sp. EL_35]MBG6151133.1 hypothetical protein [Aquimarina sp. EL_32]
MAKKFLNNTWVVRIGGSIIAALGLRLIDLIFIDNLLWDKTKRLFSVLIDFFNTNYSVKLYWLVLIPILFVITILLIFYLISLFIGNNNDSNQRKGYPDWVNYNQDVFNGIQYRWRYNFFGSSYQIKNLKSYCNKCSCLLIDNKCPNCKKRYGYSLNTSSDGCLLRPLEEIEALIFHRIDNKMYK